jgi:hypothetical protein
MIKDVFSWLLIALSLFSCKHNETIDIMQEVVQKLNERHYNNTSDRLCLFLMDNMPCVACLEREIVNIKKDSVDVTVIGIFSNKRIFLSTVTDVIDRDNIIFIEKKKVHQIINSKIFYFTYNPSNQTYSDIFYPDPCDPDKTSIFFNTIKEKNSFNDTQKQ